MLTGEKEDIRKRKRGKGTLIIIDRKGKEVGRKEESESKSRSVDSNGRGRRPKRRRKGKGTLKVEREEFRQGMGENGEKCKKNREERVECRLRLGKSKREKWKG